MTDDMEEAETVLYTALSIRNRTRSPAGFTLLELLVVVSIITMLIALVLSSLAKVRQTARGVVCMNQLKTVAFDFFQFAGDWRNPVRQQADSDGALFTIEDFQESLYRIDEFWDVSGQAIDTYQRDQQLLICPDSTGELQRMRNLPCSRYAVTPVEHISIGFNMRLDRVSMKIGGWSILSRTRLNGGILEHPNVPLALDVDGRAANDQNVLPYYSAPPIEDGSLYDSGRFWFPSLRHNGNTNAAFIGGHVLSSPNPEKASGWMWRYEPDKR